MERRERWDGAAKMNENGNGSGLDWTRILAMPGCVSLADKRRSDNGMTETRNTDAELPFFDSLIAASPYLILLGVVVAFFLD